MSLVRVDARTSYSLMMSLNKSAVGSVRVPLFCEKCYAKVRAQGCGAIDNANRLVNTFHDGKQYQEPGSHLCCAG
jgi:hypothetical protein